MAFARLVIIVGTSLLLLVGCSSETSTEDIIQLVGTQVAEQVRPLKENYEALEDDIASLRAESEKSSKAIAAYATSTADTLRDVPSLDSVNSVLRGLRRDIAWVKGDIEEFQTEDERLVTAVDVPKGFSSTD